ncbi:MAG TPA: hypothetical protein VIR65_14740 [Rhizorhapis sp.]
MKFFLLVFFTAIASPALAADQFDLVCTSTEGSADRYRIDLTKGEACSGNCDRIWKMGEATTGELKVINKQPAFRGDMEESMFVDRQTGQYRYYNYIDGLRPHSRKGVCQVAPFSGFPAQKF